MITVGSDKIASGASMSVEEKRDHKLSPLMFLMIERTCDFPQDYVDGVRSYIYS
jgi:hypothetical protein